MTKEELEEVIKATLFQEDKEKRQEIALATGRGGAIEIAKAFLEDMGKPNPTDKEIETTLQFYIAMGKAKVHRWTGDDGREYESWMF